MWVFLGYTSKGLSRFGGQIPSALPDTRQKGRHIGAERLSAQFKTLGDPINALAVRRGCFTRGFCGLGDYGTGSGLLPAHARDRLPLGAFLFLLLAHLCGTSFTARSKDDRKPAP